MRRADLDACWTSGRRAHSRYLDLAWRPNTAGRARLAIVVPRFQQTAVARNLVRRRLRDLVRRGPLSTLPAVDLVLRARRAAYAAPYEELRADLGTALAHLQ